MLEGYNIEMPINKDSPYQKIYRGRNAENHVVLIVIFSKQNLNEELQKQIIEKSKLYPHVGSVIQNEKLILVTYKASSLWVRLSASINRDRLSEQLSSVYQAYMAIIKSSGDYGFDFDPEFIYAQDENVYLMDYGVLKGLEQLPNSRFDCSYYFGQLVYQLLFDRRISERYLKSPDLIRRELNRVVQVNKLNHEIHQLLHATLLKELQFDDLGQLPALSKKRKPPPVIQFLEELEFISPKTKAIPQKKMQLLSSRPQSQNQGQLNPMVDQLKNHQIKVKHAINEKTKCLASTKSIDPHIPMSISSFKYASDKVQKNLRAHGKGNQQQFCSTQNNFFGATANSVHFNATVQHSTVIASQNNDFFRAKFISSQPEKPAPTPSIQPQLKQPIQQRDFLAPPVPKILGEVKGIQEDGIQKLEFQQEQRKEPKPPQPQNQQNQLNQLNQQNQPASVISNTSQQPVQKNSQKQESSKSKLKTPPPLSFDQNSIKTENIDALQLDSQQQLSPRVPSPSQKEQGKRNHSEPAPQEVKIIKASLATDMGLEEPKVLKPEASKPNPQKMQTGKSADSPRPNQEGQLGSQDSMLDSICQEYSDWYNNYLEMVNIIGITIKETDRVIGASKNVWIVPLTLVFKRLLQIRTTVYEDLKINKNAFNLIQFQNFKKSKHYKELRAQIKQGNEVTKKELESMIPLAENQGAKIDQKNRDKMLDLIKSDQQLDLKLQALSYLHQVLGRVKKLISQTKLKQQTSANPPSELQLMRVKYMVLVSCCILYQPLYEMREEYYNKQTYVNNLTKAELDALEKECDALEEKVNFFVKQ